MDPIVLAFLIMGDGNFDKGRNRAASPVYIQILFQNKRRGEK